MYLPCSDAVFDIALDILSAHMRAECFADVVRSNDGDDSSDDLSPEERAYYENLEPNPALLRGEVENFDDGVDQSYCGGEEVDDRDDDEDSSIESSEEYGEVVDDRSNQQLWQRLKNDVEQDLALDEAPHAQLQVLFKQWIYARGAIPSESSRYRFFIIMDQEVVQNLLSMGLPSSVSTTAVETLPVKVFDAEYKHVRLHNSKLFQPRLVARVSKDEGWFWAPASMLANLFFEDRTNEWEVVRSWDSQDQPIYRAAGLGLW